MSGEPTDISGYDRALRSDEELIAALASGQHQRELALYLGEAEYGVLAPLARVAAAASATRGAVFVIPGIMGTQLGLRRDPPWPRDLLWIDAIDISRGRLMELRIGQRTELLTLGGISYTYLALQLRLRAAGYRVILWDYDWRHSLKSLGEALAARLQSASDQPLRLVAHSMGGLIARAALAGAPQLPLDRLVTLGAPHRGTLAVVQALRGSYPTVRRIAAIDQLHSAEQLAQQVFSGFQSLYDMLPVAGALDAPDLFDDTQWPRDEPRPDPARLRTASQLQQHLAAADARLHCIAGFGQRTATGATLTRAGFEYRISSDGDGTVPTVCATLDGADNYYAECEHSELPRSESVTQAVLELLERGSTARLGRQWQPGRERAVLVSDEELRNTCRAKVDWRMLSADERRSYLNRLNQPPPQYDAAIGRGG